MPGFDGFVNNWDPPTYTDVTRLVDPVLELAIFVLLALALGVEIVSAWARARRMPAGEDDPYGSGPNEMVVLPADPA